MPSQSSRRAQNIVFSDAEDDLPVAHGNSSAQGRAEPSKDSTSQDMQEQETRPDRPRRRALEDALRDPVWKPLTPGKCKKSDDAGDSVDPEDPAPSTKSKSRKRLRKGRSADKETEDPPSQSRRRLAAAEFAAPSMNSDDLDGEDTPPRPSATRSTLHKHARVTTANKSENIKSGDGMQHRHVHNGEESEVEAELDEEEDEDKEAQEDNDDEYKEETDSGEGSESDDPELARDDPKALRTLFNAEKPLVIDRHTRDYANDDENDGTHSIKPPRTHDDGRAGGKKGSGSKNNTAGSAERRASRGHSPSPHAPAPRPSDLSNPSATSKRLRGTSDSEVEEPHRHKDARPPKKKPKPAPSSLGTGRMPEKPSAAGSKEQAPKKAAGSIARRDHEIPRIASPARDEPLVKHRSRTADEGSNTDNDLDEDISDSDPNIELVQPAKAGHKLALLDQRPRVRKTAQLAMKTTQTNLLLNNAFPDGPDKYTDFARDALLQSADSLGFKDIKTRLKRDADYAHDLASLPVQRISTFRGKVKGLTDQVVSKTYDLDIGDPVHVKWLKTRLRYIYPNDYKNDNVRGNEPYGLDIFAQTIRQAWFKSARSFGWTITDKFASSLPEKPSEKEIPAPMLALVATAVYASILDHEPDVYEASDFTANDYADAYTEHIRVLSAIKQNDLRAYHALMHGIYLRVCGPKAARAARNSDVGDALMFLNIKGMARD